MCIRDSNTSSWPLSLGGRKRARPAIEHPGLLDLFEDYFTLLPTYKRPGPEFQHLKPVYGYIPARHSMRRQEDVYKRQLQVWHHQIVRNECSLVYMLYAQGKKLLCGLASQNISAYNAGYTGCQKNVLEARCMACYYYDDYF